MQSFPRNFLTFKSWDAAVPILVHCKMGMNRSATVALALLSLFLSNSELVRINV